MKVYVLGDSISVHYGPFLRHELAGFADYARKGGPDAADTDWENPAEANGGDSRLVRVFLTENLTAIKADVLLLNCGLHDLRVDRETGAYQVSPANYQANLETVIPMIAQHGIRPIWITTTPVVDANHNRFDLPYRRFSKDVITYNQIADNVMKSHGVSIIDLFAFTRELGPDIYLDHVHHPDPVRAQQAKFIAARLKAHLH